MGSLPAAFIISAVAAFRETSKTWAIGGMVISVLAFLVIFGPNWFFGPR